IEKTIWQKVKEEPSVVSVEEKIELVMDLDKAQKIDEKIVASNSVYQDSRRIYRLVNSAGAKLEWDESRVRVMAQAVAREGSNLQIDYDIED
ncbi:hypothetical protein GWN63_01815, partial [Candidatus Bathyarchaeota archaeon]|nr:hypothetical protein [Candidatus Bathyarchaeota archaeon]